MVKKKQAASGKKDENASVGFPHLEKLLEHDKPDFTEMLGRHDELIEMSKSPKVADKQKIQAKHAALAYDKFFGVLNHLVEVKQKMLEKQKKPSSGKAKK